MKKGTYKCKVCKGTGQVDKETNYLLHHQHGVITMKTECKHCKGDGYLDWIENVVGKEMSEHDKNKVEIKKWLQNGNFKLTSGKRK